MTDTLRAALERVMASPHGPTSRSGKPCICAVHEDARVALGIELRVNGTGPGFGNRAAQEASATDEGHWTATYTYCQCPVSDDAPTASHRAGCPLGDCPHCGVAYEDLPARPAVPALDVGADR